MFESSLFLQEFFYRKLLLRLVVQDPFALYDLKQWPVACLYAQLTDLHEWCRGCVQGNEEKRQTG